MEYIFIDTESCTGKGDDGSLCSIGYALADENFVITERNDLLINPLPKRFSVGDKKNLKRTGVMFAYAEEEFRKAPDFKGRYEEIKKLFAGRTVLGFAMSNDVKYINDACDKFGLPRIEYEFTDVQFLYKLSHPSENSVGLKTLADKYGISYLEHRSDEDAVVSLLVLKHMLSECNCTFKQYLAKYDVKFGKNLIGGKYNSYSMTEFRHEQGLKISKRLQRLIYNEYLRKLPPKHSGDIYSFAYCVEKNEVDELRTVIDALYARGDCFTRDADICTVYVKCGEEEKDQTLARLKATSKRLKRVIDYDTLKKELGVSEINKYDDSRFLAYISKKPSLY